MVVQPEKSAMIHHLSTVRSNREGFECLGDLAKRTRNLFADELELDMSGVDFFDANMAAPLGAVLARVTDNFNAVEIVDAPDTVERILRKNRFLTRFRYKSLSDDNRTTVPFRRFRLSDEGAFEEYIRRQFRGKGIPRMSKAARRVFEKKVFEVYQNAVIHSESQVGVFACGQFFPRKNRLDFTVADAGIGVRGAVRRYFRNSRISSIPALKWALKPSNTTKRGSQPGGLGLQFLQNFSRLNRGKLQIATRFAFYEFNCGAEDFQKMSASFPGTAVTIEVNTADTATYVLATEATQNTT